jgi:predicted translin family RNA/ssDNA-binding protein
MTSAPAFKKLRDHYIRLEKSRRELQLLAGEGQRLAKQAIFALQRSEAAEATRLLASANERFAQGRRIVAHEPRLASEGMWRAALEEYCEATFFSHDERGEARFSASLLSEDPDILIGALSDLVGEKVRRAVMFATDGDRAAVERLYAESQQIVAFLTSLDLMGSLRSKGDQSRQHLRRLEDIRYDLSRRV